MWMVMINIIEKIIPVLLGGGLVGSFMTFFYDSLQTRKKRERATIALYEKYHSIEFYSKIRVSLWKIRLKWFDHTPRYKHYHDVVVEGWDGNYNHAYLEISPERKIRTRYEECYIEHHVAVSETTGLTEHQALTIGLEFWVTLNVLRKQKLISKVDIFKSKYRYDLPFISAFREAVRKKTQVAIPSWVKETEELETYFGFTDSDYQRLHSSEQHVSVR
jgi:hypothetical protein